METNICSYFLKIIHQISVLSHPLNSFRPSDAYMRQQTGPSLLQISSKPLSEPMLNIVNYTLRKKHQRNVNQNTKLSIHENAFENIVCKIMAILSQPQCVNKSFPSYWRHNDHEGVSNHQPHGCLLNRLFRRRSKKTSKLRVTGLCEGNSLGPVNSPHKGPVTRKMFPFDDFIMPWQCYIAVPISPFSIILY